MLAISAVATIAGVINSINSSGERANNNLAKSFESYSQAKSDAKQINSELESMKSRMTELQTKGGLTFVEQSELENLKESTRLLEIQSDLAKERTKREAKQAAQDAVTAYQKNFAPVSLDKIAEYQSDARSTGNNLILTSETGNLSAYLAFVRRMNELRSEALSQGNAEEADYFSEMVSDSSDIILEQIDILTDYKAKLEELGQYTPLTTDQQNVLDAINQAIDIAYNELKPEEWKQMKFDEIFTSNDNLAKQRQELIALSKAKDGLSVSDITDEYSELMSAVKDAGFSVEDLISNINSLAGTMNPQKIIDKMIESSIGYDDMSLKAINEGTRIRDWANTFSKEDLKIAYKILIEEDTNGFTLEDWQSKFDEFKNKTSKAPEIKISFDSYKSSFENILETQEKLNKAFESSSSSAGMNAEEIENVVNAYKDLEGFDASTLFITTSDGVRMNTEAFKAYNEQLQEIAGNSLLEKAAVKNVELQKAIAEGKDEDTIKSLQTELTLFQLLSDAYSTMTSDYTEMKDAMSKATDVQKTLSEIFDASQSGAALTSEQIQDVILAFRDLEGFNLSRLFNITSDGVRLNADAYKEYNKQLREYTKLQLESQIASEQANLDRMERSGVPESDIKSQQEKIAMLQLQAGIYDAANDGLTEYASALERAQTAQTNLNDALETSISSGGLSVEQIKNVYNAYKDLDGFDPANLFIATAYGVKLNTKEMKKLNDEMERQTESELLKQISSASTEQEKSYWTAMYQAYQATRSDYALMAKDLDRAANAQNNLNDAFEASQSVTGMNAEQIENVLSAFMDLNGFDAKGLFEMTATGVRMNTEAFKAYNEQLQQNTKLQFQNQIQSKKNEIDKVLGGAQSEKSLSVLQNELFQLQLLASVYDGLTSEYSKMSNQIEVAKTNQEKLNDAFEASKSDTGMTVEQIENVTKAFGDLASFDAGQLFEVTSTGVRMNTEAFKEYSAQLEKQVKDNLEARILSKENELIQAQKDYEKYSNGRTTAEKKAAKEAKARVDALTEEIATLRLLNGVYDGMTSDYVKMSEKMSEAKNTQSSLVDAFSAANSATGLTIEQIKNVTKAFQELDDFDAATLFEMTANGVRLNTKAFAGYQEQLQKLTKRGLLEKIIEKEAELREAQSKGLNTSGIENELMMYKLLASEYDGLTSKYNQYVNATSSANSRDSFENVANGYEAVGKLISQGWVTDDSVTSYLDLMLGTDRIQDSIDAYEQLSKAIEGTEHSLKDYMTFDQDGNFISKGAWDFVQDVNTLLGDGFASQDGNGIWSLDLTGDKLERVAAAFGTTTELVELMGKALSDAGMDVQFDPKDIHDYNRELEALNEELDNSHSKLKEIQDNAGDGVLGDIDLDYDAASLSLDEIDAKISELNDKKIELEADADGVEGGLEAVDALNNEIKALSEQKVMLSIGAALEGGATIEELLGLNNTELAAKLNVDTSQAETARALLESMSSADVAVPMTVKLDEGQLSALLSATGTANFELGDYPKEVPNVTGTANYNGIFPTSAPTIHGTVVYSGSFPSGGSRAAGSMLSVAHADGTAYNVLNYKRLSPSYAGGKVSLPSDETALTNEVGRESIVRNGVWYMLPPGPHMEHLKKGDIIFNAKQTQDLLSFGKTASYARSYANGTLAKAYGGGFGGSGSNPWDRLPQSALDKVNAGSAGGAGSSDSSDAERVDWIERLFKKINREIDKFRKVAESAFKSLTSRLSAAKTNIAQITREIELQGKAYERYMQEAGSVELSDEIKNLVRNGAIDITKYDKDTKKLISEYQEWYDKAQDCVDTIDDLHGEIAQFYRDSFDNIQSNAESQIKVIDHMTSMYESQLDILKEQGYFESAKLYDSLMATELDRIARLKQEKNDLQGMFDAAMASGEIEEDSEAWYEMLSTIDEIDEKLQESNLNLIKYGNAIRQIRWDAFDYLQDRITNISNETEFLIDLFDNSKLFDDNGNLTNEGSAVVGLHAQNYGTLMAQADQYAKEIKNLDAEIAKDPNNQTLLDRRQKMLELQQKAIKSAEDEKKALVDLVEDGISAQVKAMDDLIDKYQDSLESAKDLYDYQKKVSKQTKNIADIEKQLSAYQGNTSEETKATIQKLKQELQDAQEDLQETEYKQYVSDQKKLLDNLKSEYEETLNSRLDDVDGLIRDLIDYTNNNSAVISETILAATNDVGYELSDTIRRIWSREDMSLDGVVTYYGNDFGKKLTSTNAILGGIYSAICAMIEASDSIAGGKNYNGGSVDYTGGTNWDSGAILPGSGINDAVLEEIANSMTSLGSQTNGKQYYSMVDNNRIPITGIRDLPYISGISANPASAGNVDVGGIVINIPIDHVADYDDFVRKIQRDKRFEDMVASMTVNRLAGGSQFDKYRYSWNK